MSTPAPLKGKKNPDLETRHASTESIRFTRNAILKALKGKEGKAFFIQHQKLMEQYAKTEFKKLLDEELTTQIPIVIKSFLDSIRKKIAEEKLSEVFEMAQKFLDDYADFPEVIAAYNRALSTNENHVIKQKIEEAIIQYSKWKKEIELIQEFLKSHECKNKTEGRYRYDIYELNINFILALAIQEGRVNIVNAIAVIPLAIKKVLFPLVSEEDLTIHPGYVLDNITNKIRIGKLLGLKTLVAVDVMYESLLTLACQHFNAQTGTDILRILVDILIVPHQAPRTKIFTFMPCSVYGRNLLHTVLYSFQTHSVKNVDILAEESRVVVDVLKVLMGFFNNSAPHLEGKYYFTFDPNSPELAEQTTASELLLNLVCLHSTAPIVETKSLNPKISLNPNIFYELLKLYQFYISHFQIDYSSIKPWVHLTAHKDFLSLITTSPKLRCVLEDMQTRAVQEFDNQVSLFMRNELMPKHLARGNWYLKTACYTGLPYTGDTLEHRFTMPNPKREEADKVFSEAVNAMANLEGKLLSPPEEMAYIPSISVVTPVATVSTPLPISSPAALSAAAFVAANMPTSTLTLTTFDEKSQDERLKITIVTGSQLPKTNDINPNKTISREQLYSLMSSFHAPILYKIKHATISSFWLKTYLQKQTEGFFPDHVINPIQEYLAGPAFLPAFRRGRFLAEKLNMLDEKDRAEADALALKDPFDLAAELKNISETQGLKLLRNACSAIIHKKFQRFDKNDEVVKLVLTLNYYNILDKPLEGKTLAQTACEQEAWHIIVLLQYLGAFIGAARHGGLRPEDILEKKFKASPEKRVLFEGIAKQYGKLIIKELWSPVEVLRLCK